MKNKSDHEEAREEFWCKAWLAAAQSDTMVDIPTCNNWADHALAEFDQRFSPEAHQVRQEQMKQDEQDQKDKEDKAKAKTKKPKK